MEGILPGNEIIQKLPSSGKVSLSFFNFDTGARTWERDYMLTTGAITRVDDISTADIKLIMHSRNVRNLNANNLCDVIATAKANGDYSSELMISKAKLLWRYKSIMGYKSCLGI